MLSSNPGAEGSGSRIYGRPPLSSSSDDSRMYIYELRVIQQPQRARMCGFGEKDRRPCTPPPILQLVIYDRATRQPVDIDLYSADMEAEMDLIRQRAPNDSGHGSTGGAALLDNPYPAGGPEATGRAAISSMRTIVRNDVVGGGEGQTASQLSTGFLGQNAASASSIMSFSAGVSQAESRQQQQQQDQGSGSGAGSSLALGDGGSSMPLCLVRNLIGSGVTAGAKLQHMDGSTGIFFVFPDLSIRKDGEYRLRFAFFNLQSEATGELISTSTQIQAFTFSEPFRVFSAKQFPGMIESTALSKHFAKQGIKIPVRKESGRSGADPDQ